MIDYRALGRALLGNSCLYCGATEQLEFHHPRGHPEPWFARMLIDEIEYTGPGAPRVILVCSTCHVIHGHPWAYKPGSKTQSLKACYARRWYSRQKRRH